MAASNDVVSPVASQRPELTISAAAINSEPVELEATPTSPENLRAKLQGMSKGELEKELTPQERERRAQLISERKTDPAVLVDIPQTPGADQYEKSGAVVNDYMDAKLSTMATATLKV